MSLILLANSGLCVEGEVEAGEVLPTTVVFDHTTPHDLADHLHTLLGAAPDQPDSPTAPASGTGPDTDGTIGRLFRRACEEGRLREGFELLQSVSDRARPSPTPPRRRPHPPRSGWSVSAPR
ncbi:acyl carrier protein [Streptomyces hirsutus]|uniref:acyl carrier protein n=1 Tax=Streptomyces hirsutus TaxID=35620 RepID=UPI0011472683|nr:acyl carrier protein [Streptomyces hirsutus]